MRIPVGVQPPPQAFQDQGSAAGSWLTPALVIGASVDLHLDAAVEIGVSGSSGDYFAIVENDISQPVFRKPAVATREIAAQIHTQGSVKMRS